MANIVTTDTLLSSHKAGLLLQMNPSSINKWIDQGRIEAFRTPGGHRRIRAGDLVRFLDEHRMPVPQSLAGAARRRVLLVDDDPRQLAAWQRQLAPYGDRVDVRAVDNAIDALVAVGSFRPHLVLLDVFMPEVDGIEVCRRLTAAPETRDIEIVVTSADLTPGVITAAEQAGAHRCVDKPVRAPDVLDSSAQWRSAPLAPAAPETG